MMSSLLLSFLKAVSIFSICTGAANVITGASGVAAVTGHPFPVNSPAMILADSQLRFLGVMWAGWGVMLWWVSDDLQTRQVPMAILSWVMVFAGIGRVIAGWKYGFGSRVLAVVTAGEVVGPLGVWLLGGWS